MKWTPLMEDALSLLWNQEGLSASLCAEKLGVTKNAVIGKVHRMQLALHKPTESAKRRKPYEWREGKKQVNKWKPKTAKRVAIMDTIEPLYIAFLDLRFGQCHWPVGEQLPYTFCGHPVSADMSYCPIHCRMAYVKPQHRNAKDYDRIAA